MISRFSFRFLACAALVVCATLRSHSADGASHPANAAILAYLGEPVAAPANLDPKYTADALAATFSVLCKERGVTLQQLSVDTTEFPFLVHGKLEGGRDFMRAIDAELRAVPGYAYSGSVVGATREGSTYFSLNMMPTNQYPRADAKAIGRRLMIRLQMLAAVWSETAR